MARQTNAMTALRCCCIIDVAARRQVAQVAVGARPRGIGLSLEARHPFNRAIS